MDDSSLITATPLPITLAFRAKPRIWTIAVAFTALLIVEHFFFMAVSKLVTIYSIAASALNLMGCLACTAAIETGVALAGAWLSPIYWRDRLRLRAVPLRLPILVAGTLGGLSMETIFTSCMNLCWVPSSPACDAVNGMVQASPAPGAALSILVMGVLPGLVEELLFRGYIQTRLVERWGAVRGIFWTALMFGIWHGDQMQGTSAFFDGCLLGFITVRSGSIIPAMICHSALDTIIMLHVLMSHGASRTTGLVMLLVGLVVLPAAILFLRARLPAASKFS